MEDAYREALESSRAQMAAAAGHDGLGAAGVGGGLEDEADALGARYNEEWARAAAALESLNLDAQRGGAFADDQGRYGAQGGGSGGSLSSSGNRSFGAAPPFRAESSFGGRPRRFLATGGRSSISASREPSSARYVLGVRLRSWRLAPRASPSSSTPSTVLSAAGRLPIAKAEASPGDGGLGCPLGVDGGLTYLLFTEMTIREIASKNKRFTEGWPRSDADFGMNS